MAGSSTANFHAWAEYMEPLIVTISHSLGREEAIRRLKPALAKASETFPALKVEHEVWTDNRLDFKIRALGQSAQGNIVVDERSVRCEVMLPWLLHKFASIAQKVLTTRGQALLEKK